MPRIGGAAAHVDLGAVPRGIDGGDQRQGKAGQGNRPRTQPGILPLHDLTGDKEGGSVGGGSDDAGGVVPVHPRHMRPQTHQRMPQKVLSGEVFDHDFLQAVVKGEPDMGTQVGIGAVIDAVGGQKIAQAEQKRTQHTLEHQIQTGAVLRRVQPGIFTVFQNSPSQTLTAHARRRRKWHE